MPTVVKPREVVISFNENGDYLGAHYKTFTTVTDAQGAVVATRESDAKPIKTLQQLETVIGTALGIATDNLDKKIIAFNVLKDERDSLQDQLSQALTRIAQLESQLSNA